MRLLIITATVVALLSSAVVAQEKKEVEAQEQKQAAPGNSAFKTLKDRASYTLGLTVGDNFKRMGFDVDLNVLVKGLEDGLSGSKPQLNEQEIQETMEAFQKETAAKQAERAKVAGEKNKKEGDAFHAENKKKEGVKTTASGLQYRVIESGKGKTPKPGDTVLAHYKGKLLDGTVFDSSYDRGEPGRFAVDGVIKGWSEALQLMKVGDKWEIFVPSSLGYGERGVGNVIGPNATLVFETELLEVQPGNQVQPGIQLQPANPGQTKPK